MPPSDRALFISPRDSSTSSIDTLISKLFPDQTITNDPSQVIQLHTKYYQTLFTALSDQYDTISSYLNEFCDDEVKVLRDVMKILILIVDDLQKVSIDELINVSQRFEIDGNDDINLIIYLTSEKDTKLEVNQLRDKLLDAEIYNWEIITTYQETQGERYGVERLREAIDAAPWGMEEGDQSVDVEDIFGPLKLEAKDQEEEEEEEEVGEQFKDIDIMTLVSQIQNFKDHITDLTTITETEKHERIMKFINNLNI
ncbi:hypothetical protein WICPIJ_006785 [Wickerhamomyces pijperi]|uniref:Increased recombination centers protein 6 n=1 Tax=Wickerhamomyces pijperi TaxID=599730 RepID=A0A9P8TKK0_WICPI|nr:hypothetical protein WICPIJ_006785 [Wickerhamomyces pijperi]